MWSRLLSVLLPTLLWSTQAFLVPHSLAAGGAIRCFSRGRREQPLSAHSERRSPAATGAAEVSTSKRPRATSGTVAMSCSGGACDRRAFFSEIARAAAGLGLAAGTLAPPEAAAKEELDAPVDWKAEFGAVKKSTDLVVSDLRNLATSGDWEELMDQCKGYDQSIRKGLMGNVRKKMPKELKGDAMLYRNNITFDLIAVNKAARVEDKSKALEVINVLESDIKDFLNLEKRI